MPNGSDARPLAHHVSQIKNSLLLVGNSVAIRVVRFGRQLLMAYYLGVSAKVDEFLVAQIIPAIILAVVNPAEVIITLAKKQAVSDRLLVVLTAVVMALGLALAIPFGATLPAWARLYGIRQPAYQEFRLLSLIFIANIFPALLVSVCTSVAFMKDRYAFYSWATIGSEVVGLVCIAVMAARLGIMAFAVGTLVVSVVNGVLLATLFGAVWRATGEPWRDIIGETVQLLRRLSKISAQVAVSYAGSFLDRALSVRFMQEGYLSRVSYSQAIFEIPNTMIGGSIGATTYVEQARRYSFSGEQFEQYTHRMFSFMVYLLGALQLAFVAAAPMLLIVLYRRGRFTNDAVDSTLLIVELLALGLLPAGLTTFFERTLYVVDRFGAVFVTFIGRVLIKIVLIAALIKVVPHIIPLSTTLSLAAGACFTYALVTRTPVRHLLKREHIAFVAAVTMVNGAVIYANHRMLPIYLAQTNLTIVAALAIIAVAVGVVAYAALRQSGILGEFWIRALTVRQ